VQKTLLFLHYSKALQTVAKLRYVSKLAYNKGTSSLPDPYELQVKVKACRPTVNEGYMKHLTASGKRMSI